MSMYPLSLQEGLILSRPNRFLMNVKLNGHVYLCHCPSTGRIGDIVFDKVSCLVSKPKIKGDRKTAYTVEAISLGPPGKHNKNWIGINQSKANDYLYYFLKKGALSKMIPTGTIQREVKLGDSRIDFLVGDFYIEVKTPLIMLPGQKHFSKFNSFDRLIKHYRDLAKSAGKNKAIVLLCYLYDAKPFSPPKTDGTNFRIKNAVRKATGKGVENWQVNLKIDKKGVKLLRYFRLDFD
ncbi:Sugar fermentation stimulation protein A [Candidatus Bilamarchaeum dharawalense]|uniref:Sugar fermentation stimulation protein A n=1 Tax=Candidatus Bilamarchaeum dharawalense TaxID=2885759 RepID=A0A5E4LUT5_9ARCH|nr:Sugar fermentation stimulation protein A [Candidatus Bilamarchaeum dharawalense]